LISACICRWARDCSSGRHHVTLSLTLPPAGAGGGGGGAPRRKGGRRRPGGDAGARLAYTASPPPPNDGVAVVTAAADAGAAAEVTTESAPPPPGQAAAAAAATVAAAVDRGFPPATPLVYCQAADGNPRFANPSTLTLRRTPPALPSVLMVPPHARTAAAVATHSTRRINCPSLMSDRGMGSHPSHSEADPTIVGSPVATPRSIQRRRLRPHAPFSVAHVSLKFSGTSVRLKALPDTLTGREMASDDESLHRRLERSDLFLSGSQPFLRSLPDLVIAWIFVGFLSTWGSTLLRVHLTQQDGWRRRDFRLAQSRQGRTVFAKKAHRKEK